MERQRSELVPIGDALADLGGPVTAPPSVCIPAGRLPGPHAGRTVSPPPTFGPNVTQGRTQSREPTLTAHPPGGGLRGGPPAGDV